MSAVPPRSLRLADVARIVGGTLSGDPEATVAGIAPLESATQAELSFLASAKYARFLAASEAGAVLVTPDLSDVPGRCTNRLIVARPHDAMVALLPRFYAMPSRPFVGVHPLAVVAAEADLDPDICVEAFAVIGSGARVGRGAWIGPHCVLADGISIGAGTRLFSHVTLYPGASVGARCTLHSGVRIGSDGFGFVFRDGAHQKVPHVGRCLIGDDVEIGANSTIDRGSIDATVIGDGTKIDNLVHVGHNVRIGKLCLFAAGVGISGSTHIGDGVVLAGQVGVAGHLTIGSNAIITAQAGVLKNVPAGETWGGFPARPHRDVMKGYAAIARLPGLLKRLEHLLARRHDT